MYMHQLDLNVLNIQVKKLKKNDLEFDFSMSIQIYYNIGIHMVDEKKLHI